MSDEKKYTTEYWRYQIAVEGETAIIEKLPLMNERKQRAAQIALDEHAEKRAQSVLQGQIEREERALDIAQESNEIAKKANTKSVWAVGIAVIAILVSIGIAYFDN